MKIIGIGDLHGRNDWTDIIAQNLDADKYIFIGDYFDTHEKITPEQQIQNFEILTMVKKNIPDKMVLLIGNHDYHYLDVGEQYSGFQPEYKIQINKLLQEQISKGNMQMSYSYGKFLFTHAGVTKSWARYHKIDLNDVSNSINKKFKDTPKAFKFSPGFHHDPYGDEIGQTPIWVRPGSLRADKLDDFVQVVGHTEMKEITMFDRLILIDSLRTYGEYLEIEDGEVSIRTK